MLNNYFQKSVAWVKNEAKAIGVLALVLAGFVLVSVQKPDTIPAVPVAVPAEAPSSLASFISSLMDECGGGKHSPAKRAVLSAQMERISAKYLTGTNQHAFIALLCLETRMGTAQNQTSHAGAKGIAQVMVGTAKDESVRCGLGEINEADLSNDEINLTIAACHYAKLVADLGPAIAPAAYNGGSASEAVKALQRLTPPKNLETAGYSATVAVILARFLTDNKH